jgi:zinc transport system permease protein
MEWLTMPFMQRAVIAAVLAGMSAPAIGTYVVHRRLALLGDGLGHVAIAGVGLALMTGTAPLPVAVVICLAGAGLIEWLRQHGKATSDIGLAVLFYGGLAAGVLMSSVAGVGAGGLSSYLFGSIITVSASDLWVILVLSLLVIAASIGLAPQLFAVCNDESFAHVVGLPVKVYNYLIVALAAITVTISMRTVGLLLVSALMVIPVASAQNIFHGFRASLFGAMGIGLVVSLAGVSGSYYADLAPGALIVVIAIAVFALSWPIAVLVHRRGHRPTPEPVGPRP